VAVLEGRGPLSDNTPDRLCLCLFVRETGRNISRLVRMNVCAVGPRRRRVLDALCLLICIFELEYRFKTEEAACCQSTVKHCLEARLVYSSSKCINIKDLVSLQVTRWKYWQCLQRVGRVQR
jgi:hypothetical protein